MGDENVLRWLAKKLDYATVRLQSIIANYKKQYTARNTLPHEDLQIVYTYWIDKEVSIPTDDTRSGRNEKRIGKLRYFIDFKHLTSLKDESVTEKEITFKKTANTNLYVCADRRIYTKDYDLFCVTVNRGPGKYTRVCLIHHCSRFSMAPQNYMK